MNLRRNHDQKELWPSIGDLVEDKTWSNIGIRGIVKTINKKLNLVTITPLTGYNKDIVRKATKVKIIRKLQNDKSKNNKKENT